MLHSGALAVACVTSPFARLVMLPSSTRQQPTSHAAADISAGTQMCASGGSQKASDGSRKGHKEMARRGLDGGLHLDDAAAHDDDVAAAGPKHRLRRVVLLPQRITASLHRATSVPVNSTQSQSHSCCCVTMLLLIDIITAITIAIDIIITVVIIIFINY